MRYGAADRLLAKLNEGDADAAGQVFEKFEPFLRMVIRRQMSGKIRPKFDSTDIVQSVWADVVDGLRQGAQRALAAGVPSERILVDPTLDFGKTTRHSLRVLRSTAQVVGLGFPVLQSLSRKDFVGETLDLAVDDRLEGTLAATAVAAWLGATVFRAHDVRATRRVVDMVASIRGDRAPVRAVRGEPSPG